MNRPPNSRRVAKQPRPVPLNRSPDRQIEACANCGTISRARRGPPRNTSELPVPLRQPSAPAGTPHSVSGRRSGIRSSSSLSKAGCSFPCPEPTEPHSHWEPGPGVPQRRSRTDPTAFRHSIYRKIKTRLLTVAILCWGYKFSTPAYGGHLEILYGFRRYGLRGGWKFCGDGRGA